MQLVARGAGLHEQLFPADRITSGFGEQCSEVAHPRFFFLAAFAHRAPDFLRRIGIMKADTLNSIEGNVLAFYVLRVNGRE